MELFKKLTLLLLCATSVTTAFGMEAVPSDDELLIAELTMAASSKLAPKGSARFRPQSAPVAVQCEESDEELTWLLREALETPAEYFISGKITERDIQRSRKVFSPDGDHERSKAARVVEAIMKRPASCNPVRGSFSPFAASGPGERPESGFKSASPGTIFETEGAPAQKDDGKMSICSYNPWGVKKDR